MNANGKEKGRNTQRFSYPDSFYLMNRQGIQHLLGKSSNRGKLREKNEDSVATIQHTQILKSISYPTSICILSDGLGGHDGGEVASRMTVSAIAANLMQSLILNGLFDSFKSTSTASYRTVLENATFAASDQIYQTAQQMENEMGATAAVALIIGRNAYVLNVGDSRTYIFNQENGLQLITHDHSLVFRFYMMGDVKFEDIYKHPQRNQILRSLGEAGLREKLQEMMTKSNHPYFYQLTLDLGDSLLLCSDGLWQTIRDNEIEKILRSQSDPQMICNELVDTANLHGGDDNISVIYLKIL
ncbi:serine/threonine-protein phosphatase [candidate division KSB1 bacterium]|nr:serine/threonine-protein phosphatase [candidate division KSB1 bacterium]